MAKNIVILDTDGTLVGGVIRVSSKYDIPDHTIITPTGEDMDNMEADEISLVIIKKAEEFDLIPKHVASSDVPVVIAGPGLNGQATTILDRAFRRLEKLRKKESQNGNAPPNNPSHEYCNSHIEMVQNIVQIRTTQEYQNKALDKISMTLENLDKKFDRKIDDVSSKVDECPIKQQFLQEGIAGEDKAAENKRQWMVPIIVATIGFIAALTTGVFGAVIEYIKVTGLKFLGG